MSIRKQPVSDAQVRALAALANGPVRSGGDVLFVTARALDKAGLAYLEVVTPAAAGASEWVLRRDPPEAAEPPKPWRAEVTTSDSGSDRWYANALRFETREAALKYASDLSGRWMLVTRWRAVDESVPEHQAYEPGSEDGGWL